MRDETGIEKRNAPEAGTNAEVIGEIVESRTTGFVAQCPRAYLHTPPLFGSFVRVLPNGFSMVLMPEREQDPFAEPAETASLLSLPEGVPDDTLYALVTEAATGSVEPGRRPAAYGLSEAQLREEQPQIFDLLATTFSAVHIGYARAGRFRPHLPPRPPRLHAFVTECTPEEIRALTDAPDFLRSVLAAPLPVSPDELLAAALRHAVSCRNNDFAFLVRAGKRLALLLRDDPERLSALLRKLEP
jgi:hypothetical protein